MAPHIKQSDRSYAEQAQALQGCEDLNILRNAYPKPDVTATEQEAGAYRLPFSQVPMVPVQVGGAGCSGRAQAMFVHGAWVVHVRSLQLAQPGAAFQLVNLACMDSLLVACTASCGLGNRPTLYHVCQVHHPAMCVVADGMRNQCIAT
jgi:hypothetical protein